LTSGPTSLYFLPRKGRDRPIGQPQNRRTPISKTGIVGTACLGCLLAATLALGEALAEVNPRMPRTHGDSFISVTDIDRFVESDLPLHELKAAARCSHSINSIHDDARSRGSLERTSFGSPVESTGLKAGVPLRLRY
jgi:hypothetical protein